MSRMGWLIVGLLLGAVGVLLAQRNPQARDAISRVDQSLQGFIDGVGEGFREEAR